MKYPNLSHGTVSCYVNNGCRCAECKKANTDKQAGYRERMAESGPPRKYRYAVRQFKKDAVAAYGGKCVCCGEWRQELLCVTGKISLGEPPYRQLRDAGFPEGFRVSCLHCRASAAAHGICRLHTKATGNGTTTL